MTVSLGRRELIQASLTAAGALLVGLEGAGCAPAAQSALGPRGELAPSVWLRVAPDDTVTLTLDRVEMGQGTMTSHAALVAEELEVDPARIVVEFARAHRAFDNPDTNVGMQLTGGSASVRTSFDPLRRAGATTREMLRRAAARRLGVPLEQCRAEDGSIVHAASGRRLRYGALVGDAVREAPLVPTLKAPREFRWIGKSLPRKDARAKVDGSAVYGIDVKLEGLLTAVILRAPREGAKLASFDGARATSQPGIVAVLAVPSGVAVVATSYWRARAAARLVEVRWTGGSTSSSDALRDELRARAKLGARVVVARGSNPLEARAGEQVIEAVYEVPYLAHATMEPQNATARKLDGRWEVWAPTQGPGIARDVVQQITGAGYDAIVIHQTFVGGGFGRRLAQDYVAEAVHVSKALSGRAVKVLWSREDDFAHDNYRPVGMNLLRACTRNGQVVGWFHRIVSPSIVSQIAKNWAPAQLPNGTPRVLKTMFGRTATALYGTSTMQDEAAVEGASTFAYGIPNLRIEYANVSVPVQVGFWRGVGQSENGYIVESFLDEVARAMRQDPLALRRALLQRAPKNLRVLELAASRAGWGSPLPPGRFRGIAQTKAFGTYCAQVAEVSVHGRDVRVHRVVAAIDCGLVVNPEIVRAQVEGAIVFGLGAALRQEITLTRGEVDQKNFHHFEPLRLVETPSIEVHIVPSDESPQGVGEPGLPPIAPAVCNAIFAATGRAVRTLPVRRHMGMQV